jgi:hypothetical protein
MCGTAHGSPEGRDSAPLIVAWEETASSWLYVSGGTKALEPIAD